jgi:Leucine-rich repeat (LRR) protein
LLSNLFDLELRNNQLTGSVPSQLGTLSSLVSVELGQNILTGSIPGQISMLEFLDLSDNALIGTSPTELGFAPTVFI